jgi:hypothetical protein
MRKVRFIAVLLLLIVAATPAFAAGPSLSVAAPEDGAVIEGSTVKVTFTTAEIKLVPTTVPISEAGKRPDANKPGEGHLHFVLDLQPLVVWEKAEPYTFTDVPAGEHQLMAELVQNDHSSLSPRVMQMIHFRTIAVGQMPATMPVTGEGAGDGVLSLLLLALVAVAAGARMRRMAW